VLLCEALEGTQLILVEPPLTLQFTSQHHQVLLQLLWMASQETGIFAQSAVVVKL
jgi:hypothetical protein